MKLSRIIETCIYSTNLRDMKQFYQDILDLELVSEEPYDHVFFKVGKSMLLIFDPNKTMNKKNVRHGTSTPPGIIHLAFEINKVDYKTIKDEILDKKIDIKKEVNWSNGALSLYFNDPTGNLVEIVTDDYWPV